MFADFSMSLGIHVGIWLWSISIKYTGWNMAITNAVCLNNASFFSLICANAFYFHALSLFISFFFYLHHAQCF